MRNQIAAISLLGMMTLSPVFAQGNMPKPAPDFRQAASAPVVAPSSARTATGFDGAPGATPADVGSNGSAAPAALAPANDTTSSAGATAVALPRTAVVPASSQPLSGQVTRSGVVGLPLNGQVGSAGAALNAQIGATQTPPALNGARSQNVPPEMFRLWLQKGHPDFALTAARNSEETLVEVKGQWDDASKTLRALGIPYHQIKAGELKNLPLDNVKVLVVNCPGDVPRQSLQRVRDWVAKGGYLLATDWALDNLIQKAFPGYVEADGRQNHRSIYDAELVDPVGPLFANTVTNAHWKMDNESHMLRVVKPGTVRVLARSTYLNKEDPASGGVLAVVFPFGRGQVMHVLAHFDNNALFHFGNSMPDPAPVIGISLRQALASNFIIIGLTHEQARQ